MLARCCLRASLIAIGLFLGSCSRGAPQISDQVPTVRVRGSVLVDGKPAQGVMVRCNPIGEFPEKRKAYQRGLTAQSKEDGTFSFGLYMRDGGIPAGEYSLTFIWFPDGGSAAVAADDVQKDKLNSRYNSLDKSPKKITVEKGKDLDIGPIELTTG